MTRLACLLALVTSGCVFLLPEHHGPVVCNGAAQGVDSPLYRDPNTGVCESLARTCGDACTPCAEGLQSGALLPNWALCDSSCIGLDENSCRLTGGCQAQYIDDPGALAPSFWNCLPVEPGPPPVAGTDCATLDAYTCASDDQCIITYRDSGTSSGTTQFESCGPELSPQPGT